MITLVCFLCGMIAGLIWMYIRLNRGAQRLIRCMEQNDLLLAQRLLVIEVRRLPVRKPLCQMEREVDQILRDMDDDKEVIT